MGENSFSFIQKNLCRLGVLSIFEPMAGNTFGKHIQLTTFGESHGVAIGGIVDGFPANVSIDIQMIQRALDRRKPGQSTITTDRKEEDKVELLSGIFEGKSTGTPIGFMIRNKDQRSQDYSEIKEVYRPSHADYTYQKKYGIRDYRGGGRSSARETACRVVAGALVQQMMPEIKVQAFVRSVGTIESSKTYQELDLSKTDQNAVRCPDTLAAAKMEEYILQLKQEGDSCGGVVECVIQNVPVGLGEPVFDKLNADLAKAMLSINAVKGFELGSGFAGTQMRGSEHNDAFNADFSTQSNYSGGIQGGISNGEDIAFKVAFKPVATIAQKQRTVDQHGNAVEMEAKGRHDPCVVPRAVPIVEAMAQLVLADHFLRQKINTL